MPKQLKRLKSWLYDSISWQKSQKWTWTCFQVDGDETAKTVKRAKPGLLKTRDSRGRFATQLWQISSKSGTLKMTVSAAKGSMGPAGVRWTNYLYSLAISALLTSLSDLLLMPERPSRRGHLSAKRPIWPNTGLTALQAFSA